MTLLTSHPSSEAGTLPEQAGRTRLQRLISGRAGFLAVLGLYLVVSLIVFDQIEEDAFIYFRLADNIANGQGYVFNVGGERIEAGSSVLWVALLALCASTPVDLIVMAKLLGFLLGVATLYVVYRLSHEVIANQTLRVIPSLLLAVSAPFYCWNLRGLETPLYIFTVALLGLAIVNERYRRWWGVAGLLAVLSRAEAFILLPSLLLVPVIDRERWRRHTANAAIVIGGLVLSHLWRLYYFHDFFPHALYIKADSGLGVIDTALFWAWSGLWIPGLLAVAGLSKRRQWSRPLVLLVVLVAPLAVWALLTGEGDAQKPYNRHLVPALSLVYVIMVAGLDRLVAVRPRWRTGMVWILCVTAGWMLVGSPVLQPSYYPRIWLRPNIVVARLSDTADPRVIFTRIRQILAGEVPAAPVREDRIRANWQWRTGRFFAQRYPPGITVVYDQMGQAPWYAGKDKFFIDSLGLTYRPTGLPLFNHGLQRPGAETAHRFIRAAGDAAINAMWDEPHRKWTLGDAVDHVFDLKPDVIVLNQLLTTLPSGTGRKPNLRTVSGLIALDPRLLERYSQVPSLLVTRDIGTPHAMVLRVFERHDLAVSRPERFRTVVTK